MTRYLPARILKFVLLGLIALTVFSFVVMGLWNWLMPSIFGVRAISFWQALGLFALSRILIGGLRGGPGRRMHWRHRLRERWNHMSLEERTKFVEGMQMRCGPLGSAVSAQPAERSTTF